MKKLTLLICIYLFSSFNGIAADMSDESLSGKWLFTHMNMDGTGDRKVNIAMEFLAGGVVINYDKAGKEKSRGSYEIKGDTIIYKDKNGVQKWQVKKFSDEVLQVDNSGALMFFSRL